MIEAEEELHNLLVRMKELKRIMFKIEAQRRKTEREYILKYAYVDWKKKEGLYFQVTGDKGELFYCHVIRVTEQLKEFEYIDPVEEVCAQDTITDPKKDCGYKRWVEIGDKEYENHKRGKSLCKVE